MKKRSTMTAITKATTPMMLQNSQKCVSCETLHFGDFEKCDDCHLLEGVHIKEEIVDADDIGIDLMLDVTASSNGPPLVSVNIENIREIVKNEEEHKTTNKISNGHHDLGFQAWKCVICAVLDGSQELFGTENCLYQHHMIHSVTELSRSLTCMQKLLKDMDLFDDILEKSMAKHMELKQKKNQENVDTVQIDNSSEEEILQDEQEPVEDDLDQKEDEGNEQPDEPFEDNGNDSDYEPEKIVPKKKVTKQTKKPGKVVKTKVIKKAVNTKKRKRSGGISNSVINDPSISKINKIEESSKNENSTEINPLKCNICQGIYKTAKSLTEHKYKVHRGKSFPCDLCEKTFKRAAHLKGHLEKIHKKSLSFKCDVCDRVFAVRPSLDLHMTKVHGVQEKYVCQICKETFESSLDFKNHLNDVHQLEMHSCNLCNKLFKNEDNLKRHVFRIHEAVKNFVCDICERAFVDKNDLKAHKQRIHHKGDTYTCDLCEKSFEDRNEFRVHLEDDHEITIFKCDQCEKFYKRKDVLVRHIETIHETSRQAKCEICEKVLVSKYRLKQHLIVVHGFDGSADDSMIEELDKEVSCDICDKTFVKPGALKNHRKKCEALNLA